MVKDILLIIEEVGKEPIKAIMGEVDEEDIAAPANYRKFLASTLFPIAHRWTYANEAQFGQLVHQWSDVPTTREKASVRLSKQSGEIVCNISICLQNRIDPTLN